MTITKQNTISYHNDIFFKYALAGKDKKSQALRLGIIQYLLHRDLREIKVLNPEITPELCKKKEIRLDVLMQDTKTKEYINIEMQVSRYDEVQAKRFQFYGVRLIGDQLKEGERYDKITKIYQIIFLDDVFVNDINLINHYQSINQDNHVEPYNLITRVFIHLPVINMLVKQHALSSLNEFEKLCYLFKNNSNHDILKVIKRKEDRMVRLLMEKYDEFTSETALWSWAQAIEDGEITARSMREYAREQAIKEGLEQGLEQGLKQGIKEKLEMVTSLLEQKFPNSLSNKHQQYLKSCNNEQLQAIIMNILTISSIEDIYIYK